MLSCLTQVYSSASLNFLFQSVAIKVVQLPGNQQEMENVDRLQQITIPLVVKFFGYFVEDQELYIIMEYCPVSVILYLAPISQ